MKFRALLAGVVCAAAFGACSQQDTNEATEMAGSGVNAAQDATSGVVGQTSAAVIGANIVEGFVQALAIGDLYEIQAGQIATARSRNDAVRDLAADLIIDHSAASARLRTAVQDAGVGVSIPSQMDERRQGLIDNLNAASSADFDRVWLLQQVAAHNETLTVLGGFTDNAQRPDLATFARDQMPKITQHRDRAQTLLNAL